MTDDPRDILKAAGVECADVEAWGKREDGAARNGFGPFPGDYRNAAILALARLVAKYEGMLRSAVNEWFEEEGGPAGYPEGREMYLKDLLDRQEKR